MKPNDMAEFRREKDALGEVSIPAGRYWGAQTERARHLFQIGDQRLDFRVIRAMGTQKWVAAAANQRLGLLPEGLSAPIQQAAAEIELGLHDAEFPLPIWQTGSGTQTNMNANEVIANRANEFLGHALGARHPVHPNDHVNLCQSSNDSFPTVMHIAALAVLRHELLPGLAVLHAALAAKADATCWVIEHLRGQAAYRQQQAKRLADLARSDAGRADALEESLIFVLTQLQPAATRFSFPDHELSSRKSQAVVIDDEEALDPEWLAVKTTTQPDKAAIKEALKAGRQIVGAQLLSRRSWRIH